MPGAGKTASFAPFYTYLDQFTKTGSGQTRGNSSKKRYYAFIAGVQQVNAIGFELEMFIHFSIDTYSSVLDPTLFA